MRTIKAIDLFCGAGGSSSGAVEAINVLGMQAELTAVNHCPTAIATHTFNHPFARHLTTAVDDINPRLLYRLRELNVMLASPECTHHSNARGGKPINEQSRATAYCVPRWMDAVEPEIVIVENVPEFQRWGPHKNGRAFRAWLDMCMHAGPGYRAEFRVLCAADYGDPTTRERLIVQFVRGRRRIVWPNPTHARGGACGLLPWVPAMDIIDWSIPVPSIADRKRPLVPNTVRRINEGLLQHGSPVIIAMEHGGRAVSARVPLPTVTTAKGGAFGLAYLLPQHSGGALRPCTEPAPTVATRGAISLVVEYYGNGGTQPIWEPLPTVTTRDRFGLVQVKDRQIGFRMLTPRELARAQGFHPAYRFAGNKAQQVKQIGNAVPRNMARALCLAALTQTPDVGQWMAAAA